MNRQAAKRTKIFNHKGHEGHKGKTKVESRITTHGPFEPPSAPRPPRRTRIKIEPQTNADKEVLSLGRHLVSASERPFPIASVPAQRVDALEGFHNRSAKRCFKRWLFGRPLQSYEASGMISCWRAIRSALAISALVFGLCGVASASNEQTLIDNFRREFTNRNPVLTEIQILESRPVSSQKRSSDHVYLVRAIRPDHRFEGRFEDEQFGVFLVDADRNRIVKVLDMFNTPRWLDYKLKIKEVSVSRVTVIGGGATYGDGPIMKAYDIGRTQ